MGEHKITRSGVAERSLLRADQWRPEPSPTGRDAAGLLSRKVTGEVFGGRAAARGDRRGIGQNQEGNLLGRLGIWSNDHPAI